jgi:hypothetical protein
LRHEIKNPLNFVKNFAVISRELAAELTEALGKTSLNESVRLGVHETIQTLNGNLEKILEHGNRADSIVKNMLAEDEEPRVPTLSSRCYLQFPVQESAITCGAARNPPSIVINPLRATAKAARSEIVSLLNQAQCARIGPTAPVNLKADRPAISETLKMGNLVRETTKTVN